MLLFYFVSFFFTSLLILRLSRQLFNVDLRLSGPDGSGLGGCYGGVVTAVVQEIQSLQILVGEGVGPKGAEGGGGAGAAGEELLIVRTIFERKIREEIRKREKNIQSWRR